jgi:Histidinol-phosphate/aromatic aminotransferase and cobyric acid decarboxylase
MAAVEKADCLLLVNPDNPSGNFIPVGELLEVITHYGKLGKQVIVDESFVDFAADEGGGSLINDDVLDANPNLIVVRSISKTYNVPGLRLGIVASGRADLIQDIRRELAIWNINSFGEFFLRIAPKYAAEYRKACLDMADERERLSKALAGISFLTPLPSSANYILCKVSEGWTSDGLAAYLLSQHDVYVKSFSNRQGLQDGEYVRIGVRSPEDNHFLAHCLKAAENGERKSPTTGGASKKA